jgi:large subunit ribosomal protein L32
MGAVPKSRISPRRRRNRRAQTKMTPVTIVRCPRCDSYHRPHHVCPDCGTFRGIQILEMDDEA